MFSCHFSALIRGRSEVWFNLRLVRDVLHAEVVGSWVVATRRGVRVARTEITYVPAAWLIVRFDLI